MSAPWEGLALNPPNARSEKVRRLGPDHLRLNGVTVRFLDQGSGEMSMVRIHSGTR